MSYQNKPNYIEPFTEDAEERYAQVRTHQVQLFVSGTPRQQQSATEWLVDYLSELDLEKYRRSRFLVIFHMALSTREEKALNLAIELFPDLQSQPREATVVALGNAAAQHPCLWELLCIGMQRYAFSADCFYLATDAIRHTISHWDTPTTVVHLKQALKPIDNAIDDLTGQAVLTLISELSPHPALRQLLPELKALERHSALKETASMLRTQVASLPRGDFPIPTQAQENNEKDLPLPASNKD
jgi:hypothetical protein